MLKQISKNVVASMTFHQASSLEWEFSGISHLMAIKMKTEKEEIYAKIDSAESEIIFLYGSEEPIRNPGFGFFRTTVIAGIEGDSKIIISWEIMNKNGQPVYKLISKDEELSKEFAVFYCENGELHLHVNDDN